LFALIVFFFSKVAVVGQAQLLEAEVIPININVMFTINRLPLKELDKDRRLNEVGEYLRNNYS
jgi:hypothetical protein